MDFAKYVQMLISSELYFPRADTLSDEFEGFLPTPNQRELLKILSEMYSPEKAKLYFHSLERNFRVLRQLVFISSWHLNEGEDFAMWKIYSAGNRSIAVTSSVKQLVEFIPPENAYVGHVRYVNYEKEEIPIKSIFDPFLIKRTAYKYETEYRAMIMIDLPARKGKTGEKYVNLAESPKGISVRGGLSKLINNVYVSPESES